MKRIANVGDVIEYIFEGMPILASVGLVDKEAKQYGVHVTSEYSFRCANIAQDYVYFDQVVAVYKKLLVYHNKNLHQENFGLLKRINH